MRTAENTIRKRVNTNYKLEISLDEGYTKGSIKFENIQQLRAFFNKGDNTVRRFKISKKHD